MRTLSAIYYFFTQKALQLAITTCFLALISQNTLADTHFKQQIEDSISHFMGLEAEKLTESDQGKLIYKLRGLDPRLSLKTCEHEPLVETMNNIWLRKRSHVRVSCEAPDWSLIVGLELSLMRDVLVARAPIERNQILDNMVEFASQDILSLQTGYIDSFEGIAGKVSKRRITLGQVINPHLMKDQILVPRNALVEVSAHIGGVSVSSQGVALENGAFGDFIRVRNKRSNRVIEARVVQENKVEVVL